MNTWLSDPDEPDEDDTDSQDPAEVLEDEMDRLQDRHRSEWEEEEYE